MQSDESQDLHLIHQARQNTEGMLSGNEMVNPDARGFMSIAVVFGAFPALNSLGSGTFLWSSSARAVETALAVTTGFALLASLALLAMKQQLKMNMYVLSITVVMTGSLATRTAQKFDLGQSVNALDWISISSLVTLALALLYQLRKSR